MVVWVAAIVSLPFVGLLVGSSTLRRLASRNVARRPVEAILVVLGSLLGTAIITGSLVVGDTIDRSIRAGAYDQLGPIDETVSVNGLEAGHDLSARFTDFSSPHVDGVLTFLTAGASVVHTGPGGGTQPRAQIIEVDFANGRSFGPDAAITGLVGETPRPGTAAITEDLAEKLSVAPGDDILVFAYGEQLPVRVDRVLSRTGVAGYWSVDGRQQSYNVLVAPGTVASLAAGTNFDDPGGEVGLVPPEVIVAFSNVGGVESGAPLTEEATRSIDAELDDLPLRAVPVKQNVLDLAEKNGEGLRQLYFTVGMFAVAAGVMLLVNIFVMLADERRSELGMLRAIGMRRAPLVGAFALEGWLYAISAAAAGAVLGIGVGWLITWRADAILSSGNELTALKMEFSYTNTTILSGFALGFVIALATVVLTSIRTARFNIIRAIRDIQEPPHLRPRRRYARAGLVLAAVGALYTLIGFSGPDPYGIMLGPALIGAGVAPQLARRWPAGTITTIAGVAVLTWAIVAVPISASMDIAIDIPVFLGQGLTMTASAIAVLTVHQGTIGRLLARVTGGALSVRLGLAYPLARSFRTAMTLGMFAIVILTLVYMSVLSYMFRGQSADLSADLSGGFGVIVTSSPSNPLTEAELSSVPEVDAVAPLSYVFADFTLGSDDPVSWPATGVGPELATAPPILVEIGPYPTNEAAWRAVVEDPGLVIVDNNFLETSGPPTDPANVGDTILMTDPRSGRTRELTVAAIAEDDLVGNGAFVSAAALFDLFGERATPSRFFVSASDSDAAVDTIRSSFIVNGADASTVTGLVDSMLAQTSSFFTLMQQFVGAGLIIGVAGIGVIMVRAVRERRRQVGVLRSLGFPHRSIGRIMLFEAGFIAFEGIVLGVVIALVASYGFTAAGADWVDGMTWGVPVGEVVVIVAIAIGATLVAALWPARRAAQIQPATALRIAD